MLANALPWVNLVQYSASLSKVNGLQTAIMLQTKLGPGAAPRVMPYFLMVVTTAGRSASSIYALIFLYRSKGGMGVGTITSAGPDYWINWTTFSVSSGWGSPKNIAMAIARDYFVCTLNGAPCDSKALRLAQTALWIAGRYCRKLLSVMALKYACLRVE